MTRWENIRKLEMQCIKKYPKLVKQSITIKKKRMTASFHLEGKCGKIKLA